MASATSAGVCGRPSPASRPRTGSSSVALTAAAITPPPRPAAAEGSPDSGPPEQSGPRGPEGHRARPPPGQRGRRPSAPSSDAPSPSATAVAVSGPARRVRTNTSGRGPSRNWSITARAALTPRTSARTTSRNRSACRLTSRAIQSGARGRSTTVSWWLRDVERNTACNWAAPGGPASVSVAPACRQQIDAVDVRQLAGKITEMAAGADEPGPAPAGVRLGAEQEVQAAAEGVGVDQRRTQLLLGRHHRQPGRTGGGADSAGPSEHRDQVPGSQSVSGGVGHRCGQPPGRSGQHDHGRAERSRPGTELAHGRPPHRPRTPPVAGGGDSPANCAA